jgi:hypothetical protein
MILVATPANSYVALDESSIREDQAIKDKKTTIPANRQARGLPRSSAPKRDPVLARRNTQSALECAAKYLRRSEATRNRYFLKTHRYRFDLTARSFKAEVLYIPRRRPTHLMLKQAGKVAGTHSCTLGETFDGEIALNVVRKPREQIVEGDFAEICAMRVVLNCDWPPGRRRNTTII